ncbi:MAG: hypothetical protein WC712_13470 [Candidatus Brocadiia bacterium]
MKFVLLALIVAGGLLLSGCTFHGHGNSSPAWGHSNDSKPGNGWDKKTPPGQRKHRSR